MAEDWRFVQTRGNLRVNWHLTMKLSTEQKKIAKSIVFYAIGVMITIPIFRFLFGKPFSWSDILISIGGTLTGSIIVGLLLIFGSSVPSKKDN